MKYTVFSIEFRSYKSIIGGWWTFQEVHLDFFIFLVVFSKLSRKPYTIECNVCSFNFVLNFMLEHHLLLDYFSVESLRYTLGSQNNLGPPLIAQNTFKQRISNTNLLQIQLQNNTVYTSLLFIWGTMGHYILLPFFNSGV